MWFKCVARFGFQKTVIGGMYQPFYADDHAFGITIHGENLVFRREFFEFVEDSGF